MSSTEDKVKGNTNEAVGKGKQGLGDLTDDEQLQAEGKGQETKGKGQDLKGKIKDKLKDMIN